VATAEGAAEPVVPNHDDDAEPGVSRGELARPDAAHPVSWHPEVINGPLSTRSLLRLEEALRQADALTGLTFSVYIGELTEPVRADAEAMHAKLAEPDRSVLLAVSPNQRVLEIVTGSTARRRILDRDAKLAALSMSAAFAGGDLGGGIVAGIAQLANHAGRA
jgi:hypothetical protein